MIYGGTVIKGKYSMKITQNTVVEFCYELEVDGQIVDRTTK